MRRMLALTMILALLAGCGGRTQPTAPPPAAEDAQEGAPAAAEAMTGEMAEDTADAAAQFGLELFRRCLDGENTLISPLSVLEALGMTANGAAEDTLSQMEAAFGAETDSLNAWMHTWAQGMPADEGGAVHVANSVWLNDDGRLTVQPAFLQTNGAYYGAGVFERAFEPALAEEINAWTAEHTAGRIERIVDEVPGDAMVYLINALSFDGTWENIYREDQVRPGTFTAADGARQDAQFMWSREQVFLQDEHAVGFVRYYAGRQLAFAALLPEQGMSVADYAAGLTGAGLRAMLSDARQDVFVEAAIPKFSAAYGAELSEALAAMGMTDAFDAEKADFGRLGRSETGNLYISRVMHKCTIDVDEQGTRAGAATAAEVAEAGLLGPEEQVVLDRPFVYMLIDCQTNVPLFVGAAESLG